MKVIFVLEAFIFIIFGQCAWSSKLMENRFILKDAAASGKSVLLHQLLSSGADPTFNPFRILLLAMRSGNEGAAVEILVYPNIDPKLGNN